MKGKTVRIKYSELKRHPLRKDQGTREELMELGRSYLKRPIHPIVVSPDMEVADGSRRVEALLLIGETEGEVYLLDDKLDSGAMTEIVLATAMHRKDLTPVEQAIACREWIQKTGKSAKELSEVIDRDQSTVSKLLSLWRTIPAVQQAAVEGKIGVKGWHQIGLAAEKDQEGLLAMLLSNAPVSVIEAERRRPAPSAQTSSKPARISIPLPKVKATLTLAVDTQTLDGVIAVLTEALEVVRKSHRENISLATARRTWAEKAAKVGA